MKITEFVKEAHYNAVLKGFWDDPWESHHPEYNAFLAQRLMLIVSEAGEALEALRKNDMDNFREEVADIWIRLADFSGGYVGAENIVDEIKRKMYVNSGRPPKHGKAF